jgi:hypothetical protein
MKLIVGYQIESNDGKHELPECFESYEYFEDLELAKAWMMLEAMSPEYGEFKWVIAPVFQNTIENPTIIKYL